MTLDEQAAALGAHYYAGRGAHWQCGIVGRHDVFGGVVVFLREIFMLSPHEIDPAAGEPPPAWALVCL